MTRHPLTPIEPLRHTRAYSTPPHTTPTDLHLDGNEGVALPEALLAQMCNLSEQTLRTYPKPHTLDAAIAHLLELPSDHVLATAGADDALDRTCRAMLRPGHSCLLTDPTFEMITRYASLTGADIEAIPWPDNASFPLDDFLAHITSDTRHIALVSPNNPTGQVIPAHALEAIASSAPHALVLVDHAYIEFADPKHDLSQIARGYPNVVVARTLSKAWGLAGLRVGYVTGSPEVIGWLRASGNPYALTGPSIALAIARLALPSDDVSAYIALARSARPLMNEALARAGATPTPSQSNFCFARHSDPAWVHDLLAALGVRVRVWPGHDTLHDAIRISCPNTKPLVDRTVGSLHALCPEAILFDMDGVLVDVSRSYRAAIIATASHFGATVTPEDIQQAKDQGNANNDWILTQTLLARHGLHVSLEEVTQVFESLYQGDGSTQSGLKATETATISRDALARCAKFAKLGIVTGRPRRDALEFLEREGLDDLFKAIICMEDAATKPSPEPVIAAMHTLEASTAWMIGDTPDDIRAARAATSAHDDLFVAPFGVVPPGDSTPQQTSHILVHAGAGRTFPDTNAFLDRIIDTFQ